ncbi:MAG: MBL fold metallo-hydrolase [Pirellulaceae bacterium]
MKLLFLGTTGYHPNNRRQTACLMLPELGVVLDAGTGLFRIREHLAAGALDIFLTHAHLDHVVGLTFLFDVLHQKKMKHVFVHGQAEKLQEIDQHLFAPALFPVKPPFEYRPLAGKVTLPDGGRLSHFPLEHPGGAVGYRIDWPDRSLAYVTDTTASADAPYVELIRGVDLLVHECYFPDGWEDKAELTGHSCTTPVAQVARAADVGRLLLVHVNPLSEEDDPIGLDVARAIFPAAEIAEDGQEIDF